MIRVFLLLLLSISGAWYIADLLKRKGPGYVLVYYNEYSLETSVWFGAVLLVGLIVLIALTLKLSVIAFRYLIKIGFLPKAWGAHRSKALQYQGTLAFLDQSWLPAATQLAKAAKNSETPFLNYMMAARASLADGDTRQASKYMDEAKKLDDADELSLAVLHLDIAIANHDEHTSHHLLDKLLTAYPREKRFLRKAVTLYQQDHNWDKLQALLPTLRKRKVLPAEQQQALEQRLFKALLQQAADQKNRDALEQAWKAAAKHKQHADVLHVYAQGLLALGQDAEAEKLLQAALKKQWHEGLIRLYSQIKTADSSKQLSFLEQLLESDSHNAVVLVAVARACLHDELWGKAKAYLQKSLDSQPTIEAYQLLAEVCEAHDEAPQAHQYLQAGLALAAQ